MNFISNNCSAKQFKFYFDSDLQSDTNKSNNEKYYCCEKFWGSLLSSIWVRHLSISWETGQNEDRILQNEKMRAVRSIRYGAESTPHFLHTATILSKVVALNLKFEKKTRTKTINEWAKMRIKNIPSLRLIMIEFSARMSDFLADGYYKSIRSLMCVVDCGKCSNRLLIDESICPFNHTLSFSAALSHSRWLMAKNSVRFLIRYVNID